MSIVGVTGRAQHGKDTIGKMLIAHGYTRYAFADQLKALAAYINPIIPFTGGADMVTPWSLALADYLELVGGWEPAKENPEVRRFLIALGLGVREYIGWDSWVMACAKAIDDDGAHDVVITDVRFPNEADWIHEQGGIVIRVTRPATEAVDPTNESERHVASLTADYDIVNNKDRDHLQQQVYEAVNDWGM